MVGSLVLALALLSSAAGPVASAPGVHPVPDPGPSGGCFWGEILIDAHRDMGPMPGTEVSVIPVELRAGEKRLGLRVVSGLKTGRGTVRLLSPRGTPLSSSEMGATPEIAGIVAGSVFEPGKYSLEVSLDGAAGTWSVALVAMPDELAFGALLATGPLMILIGVAFAAAWRLETRVAWRWFAVGGLLWLAGAGLKAGWGIGLNGPVLRFLNQTLDSGPYVIAACAYAGLLTGLFEIGLMIAAGLIWRRLATRPDGAIAVGIGAGSAEAIAVGIVAIAAAAAVLLKASETTQVGAAYSMAATPLFWLVGPCQRTISLLCQMASRTLVLLGVAQRRRVLYLYGLLVLAGMDAVGALSGVSEQAGAVSMWWVQVATAPFAIVGFYATRWCVGKWPRGDEVSA